MIEFSAEHSSIENEERRDESWREISRGPCEMISLIPVLAPSSDSRILTASESCYPLYLRSISYVSYRTGQLILACDPRRILKFLPHQIFGLRKGR